MKLKNTLLIFLVLALLAPAAFAQLNNVKPGTDAALPAPAGSPNVFKGVHLDAAGNPITGGTGLVSLATPLSAGTITSNLFNAVNLQPEISTRPPLRYFNTWITMGPNIGETNILAKMTNMINWGYRDAGYGFMVDEGWVGGFDTSGKIYAQSNRFPNGMAWLVAQFHQNKMRFGLICVLGNNGVYLGPGTINPGMGSNLVQSANTLADWGVDFVYLICDDCGNDVGGRWHENQKIFIAALQATGRDIQISGGVGTTIEPWMRNQMGGGLIWLWPNYQDGAGFWASIIGAVDDFPIKFRSQVRPGHYPYVGFQSACVDIAGNISDALFYSKAAIFALWHSSVVCGQVYQNSYYIAAHTNRFYLSVVEDAGAFPPDLVASNNQVQVWSEPLGNLADNKRAVVFFNRDTNVVTHTCTIDLINLGLPSGNYTLQDVWFMTNGPLSISPGATFSVTLSNYQAGFYIITPAAAAGAGGGLVYKTNFTFRAEDMVDTLGSGVSYITGIENNWRMPLNGTGGQLVVHLPSWVTQAVTKVAVQLSLGPTITYTNRLISWTENNLSLEAVSQIVYAPFTVSPSVVSYLRATNAWPDDGRPHSLTIDNFGSGPATNSPTGNVLIGWLQSIVTASTGSVTNGAP